MSIDFEKGSSNWITLPNDMTSLQNVTGATLCGWLNIESIATSDGHILQLTIGTSTTTPRADIFTRNVGDIIRTLGRRLDADGQSFVDSSSPTLATTLHVAGVFRYNAQLLEVYFNGVLNASQAVAAWTGSTSNTASQRNSIGASSSAVNFYDGLIHDLRIYNRGLSVAELQTIVTSRGKDSLFDGLVNRWKMTELAPGVTAAAGASVHDSMNLKNDGTPQNSPVYATWLVSNRRRRR
jgi:hypothetical protein